MSEKPKEKRPTKKYVPRKTTQKDATEKVLESNPDVFADIANNVLFGGREVIDPKDLLPTGARSQLKMGDGVREQERDVVKYWSKGGINIAIIGIENQSAKDDDMALRCMSYDGASYKEQIVKRDAARKAEEPVPPICPCITILLYFGNTDWTPPSLLECLEVKLPPELLPYFNDYKVNYVSLATLKDEEIAKYKSDMSEVIKLVAANKRKEDWSYGHKPLMHPNDTVNLINAINGNHDFEIAYQKAAEEKEGADMLDIIKNLKESGKVEGKAEGKAEGMAEGEVKGNIEMATFSIRNLMKNSGATIDTAFKMLNYDEKLQKAVRENLQQA